MLSGATGRTKATIQAAKSVLQLVTLQRANILLRAIGDRDLMQLIETGESERWLMEPVKLKIATVRLSMVPLQMR